MELPSVFDASHSKAIEALLAAALNPSTQDTANVSLQACEDVPGYCSLLLNLVSTARTSGSHDPGVLTLAVICVRNCVKRHWSQRSRTSTVVPAAEKPGLRSLILALIGECEGPLNGQLCLLAAAVGRCDWPRDWPELFPTIVAGLSPPTVAILSPSTPPSVLPSAVAHCTRWLKALHEILTEFSSMRLPAQKAALGAASIDIARVVAPLETQLMDQLLEEQMRGLAAGSAEGTIGAAAKFSTAVRVCHKCLEILGTLVEYGSPEVVRVEDLRAFWIKLLEHTQKTDTVRSALQGLLRSPYPSPAAAEAEAVVTFCDLSLRAMAKAVHLAVKSHPVAFEWAVQPFCEYYYSLIVEGLWKNGPFLGTSTDGDEDMATGPCEEFIVFSFVFMTSLLSQEKYFQPGTPIGVAMASFWTQQRLQSLMVAVVTNGLKMTKNELESWEEDPEEYEAHQMELTKEEAVRPAAEYLLLAVIDDHTAVGVPTLLQILASVESTPLASCTVDQLYLLDAVYQVMGLSVHKLAFLPEPQFSFPAWFSKSLLPIINSAASPSQPLPYRVLLRRTLWLIQCWLKDIPKAVRAQLYGALSYCLRHDDKAVALTATAALNALVHDIDFVASELTPGFDALMEGLFVGLRTTKLADSRQIVLMLMSTLMNCGEESAIRACAGRVLPLLPDLWAATSGEILIRPHILGVVKGIVIAAGRDSAVLWSFVLPIVSYSVNTAEDEHLSLAGDALELWQHVIQHAPEYTADISALFTRVLELIDKDLEHVAAALKLFESYTILGGRSFIRSYAPRFPLFFSQILGKAHVHQSVTAVRCLQTLVKLSGDDLPALLSTLEPCLRYALSTCILCEEEIARALAIPSFADRAAWIKDHPPTEAPAVLVGYISLFARLLVQAGQALLSMLAAWEGQGTSGFKFLAYLINSWIVRFDEIGGQIGAEGPWQRKLTCMALLSLLPSLSTPGAPPAAPALLNDRLLEILNTAVDVMEQLKADLESGSASAYLPILDDNGDPSFSARSRFALCNDIAVRTDIAAYLQHCLRAFRANVGDAVFAGIMSSLDPVVTSKLPPL